MSPSLLLGLCLVVGAPGLKDRPTKQDSIEGEWILVSRLVGGRQDAKGDDTTSRFVITSNRWVIQNAGGGKPSEWDLQLDRPAKPPAITIYPIGDPKTPNFSGIYKLEEDSLTICYVFKGERPTKFESPAGTDIRLMTLKRVREK
jgi:uncharacterized protein (TIGR03067 family)